MLANIIIIALVAVLFVLCVRSFFKGDECSSCSSAAGCEAHKTGEGPCPATQDMLSRVDAALSQKNN